MQRVHKKATLACLAHIFSLLVPQPYLSRMDGSDYLEVCFAEESILPTIYLSTYPAISFYFLLCSMSATCFFGLKGIKTASKQKKGYDLMMFA